MVSLFINSISKTKFMGMGLVAITFALILKSDVLGFQHPLVSPGFLPQIFYSDMNGFYGGLSKFQHLSCIGCCLDCFDLAFICNNEPWLG